MQGDAKTNNRESNNQDDNGEWDNPGHQREKDVINFGRKLYPKLKAPFRAICQELTASAEQEFFNILNEKGLADHLENQELCLLKNEFVKGLN